MAKDNSISWAQAIRNPGAIALKQYLFEILKEKCVKFESMLDRVGAILLTDKEIQEFGELIVEIYISGYTKAAKDQEDVLKKLGYKVKIDIPQPKPETPKKNIFK